MPELEDHNLQAFYAERLVAERHCDETSGIQNTWVFCLILSCLDLLTKPLSWMVGVVLFLICLCYQSCSLHEPTKSFEKELFWEAYISAESARTTRLLLILHLCSMKVWEGFIPSWYGCFRQLDWRDRLQMSCQLQWCRKMITSLSNSQTFPCMLFYQVGQANVKVSRRIADILYTIWSRKSRHHRCFEIFLWRLMRISSNSSRFFFFFSEKNPAEWSWIRTYLLGLAYFHNQVWMELGSWIWWCGDQ